MGDWLESAYSTQQQQPTPNPGTTPQPGSQSNSGSSGNGSSFIDIFNSVTSGTSTFLDSLTGFLGSIGGKSKTDASGMPYFDDGGNSGDKQTLNIDFTKVLIIVVVGIAVVAGGVFLFKWLAKKKPKAA